MDIYAVQRVYPGNECKLLTWHNGIGRIGTINTIYIVDDSAFFQLSHVEELSKAQGSGIVSWHPSADDTVIIPKKTLFEPTSHGRTIFSLPDRSLATLFPPGLDPKLPLPNAA